MDLFLKAIETSEDFQERMNIDSTQSPNSTENEVTLLFESRPPQWCLVDKSFSMVIAINGEHRFTELEAVLYSKEGEIIQDFLECFNTLDKSNKKMIVSVESNRATFKLKFCNGKEDFVNIGVIGKANQKQKCMLKSPPIKVIHYFQIFEIYGKIDNLSFFKFLIQEIYHIKIYLNNNHIDSIK